MSIKKGSRLAKEIIGYIGIAGVISIFFYWFLIYMSQAIVDVYCARNDIFMDRFQLETTDFWQRRVCLVTAVIIFLFLCFFLTGQKFIYIRQIIQGVDALRENDMNYEVPVEGDDELAKLAESINYLAKSQRELREKEIALKEEKDAFIRALSHDIRTPLTSVLAMSEYLAEKEGMTSTEIKDYILLVKNKSAQMKILTDRLLNEGQRKPIFVENGKLLFEQLADEWHEVLEDEFECAIFMDKCEPFQGEFDIAELRRIFDNLASNVGKYADADKDVILEIYKEEEVVVIRQLNTIKRIINDDTKKTESYGIGLQSIERLAKIYHGNMEIKMDKNKFEIIIRLAIV